MGAGQPGKSEGDGTGLVGCQSLPDLPRRLITRTDYLIHRIRRPLRLCRGCNESRFHDASST